MNLVIYLRKNYLAAGYRPSNKYGEYNCDAHQDIQEMSYESNSFDAVICIDVLEHVKDPNLAISEIHRVLRGNGELFLTVPFMNGFHVKSGVSGSNEEYGDYWRFTHQGLKILLSKFTSMKIESMDRPIEARIHS